jgi:LAS superfamily LD-carboxypeptidase LdcB
MKKLFLLIIFFSLTNISFANYDEFLLRDPQKKTLTKDYQPKDLVDFKNYKIKTTNNSNPLEKKGRKIMMDDLHLLINQCEKETQMQIFIRSGFRSAELQDVTYEKYGSEYSVPAGKSEHQLGLAIDIEVRQFNQKKFLSSSNPVVKCFQNNAYKYGFIQTYQAKNPYYITPEPWHYRYIGKKAANYLKDLDKLNEPWIIFNIEKEKIYQKKQSELKRILVLREKVSKLNIKKSLEKIREHRKNL